MWLIVRSALFLVLLWLAPRTVHAQALTIRDAAGRDRKCQAALYPKILPSLAALGDSAGLVSWAAGAAPADAGDLVLSLLFEESGRLVHLRQIEPPDSTSPRDLPPASLFREQASGKTAWAIRLRASGSGGDRVIVERSVYCPPEPAGPPTIGRSTATVHVTSGDRPPAVGQRIRMEARLELSDGGVVTSVNLTRSSGISQLDADWVGQLRMTKYLPALVDGVAIPSWVRTSGAKLRL